MAKKSAAVTVTKFEGVFCSGLYIPTPSMVTALALLFERVYIPNQIRYALAFAKKYHLKLPASPIRRSRMVSRVLVEGKDCETLQIYKELDDEQRVTLGLYLGAVAEFMIIYRPLFPLVLDSSIEVEGRHDIGGVKLVKKGVDGGLNTYRVRIKRHIDKFIIGEEGLEPFIKRGAIPVLGGPDLLPPLRSGRPQARELAVMLGLRAVEMVLPTVQAAHPEVILEARDRLKDQLPAFWSAMLKLSVDLAGRLKDPSADLERECIDLVDTLVRPALVELALRLEKERKNWFYKILAAVGAVMKVFIAKPPTGVNDLVTRSLLAGGEATVGLVEHQKKIDQLKLDTGLAYLIDVDAAFGKLMAPKPARGKISK